MHAAMLWAALCAVAALAGFALALLAGGALSSAAASRGGVFILDRISDGRRAWTACARELAILRFRCGLPPPSRAAGVEIPQRTPFCAAVAILYRYYDPPTADDLAALRARICPGPCDRSFDMVAGGRAYHVRFDNAFASYEISTDGAVRPGVAVALGDVSADALVSSAA